MRINISIELRRPARRSVALLLGALLLLTPAVVLASHQFPSDVPTTHPFHDQISAIAKAGITAGFPDGGYHPSDPVTRQAMAAFMQRGFGRVGLAAGTAPTTASVDPERFYTFTPFFPVRDLTITVPGASNAFSPNQLVHLQGHVTFDTAMSSAKGCPCEFMAQIWDIDATTGSGMDSSQAETFEGDASSSHGFDVEALFTAPPGPRTYALMVALSWRQDFTDPASFAISNMSSLSAMTFPFGPTGTNDL